MLWLLTKLSNSPLLPIHLFQIALYISTKDKGTDGILGLIACGLAEVIAVEAFEISFGTSIDCVTVLIMRLLNTSTLCIWDINTPVLLCFYGDLMRIFILLRIFYNFS